MAGSGLPPEAIPPDIPFKCHPKQLNTTVYCVLCESVFHKSDFNRKKGVKYVSNVLVICDEHPEVDLTSISSEDPRVILLTLKNNLQAKNIEHKNLCVAYNSLQAEYTKLQQKYNALLREKEEEQEDLETTKTESDYSAIKTENELLWKLNTELKSNNKLLEELLENEKERTKHHTHPNHKSYAEAATSKLQLTTHPVIIPKIVIKRKNKDDKTDMKERVLHYLAKDKTIQTKKIDKKSNDEIAINCMNSESAKTAEKYLNAKLSHIYKVQKQELLKPIVKIVGIENVLKQNQTELENDINTRNFSNYETKCRIVHLSNINKTGKQTAIMELTAELHKHIKENKDRLFVGHQSCKIFDEINVKPCHNCGRTGHSSKKCTNPTTCLRCAGNHLTKDCKEINLLCELQIQ